MKRRTITVVLALAMIFAFIQIIDGTDTTYAADNPYTGGNSNCTWTAWQQAKDNTGVELPKWGNAGTWYDSARNAGYSVGGTPRAQSIAVYSGNPGHVAYVADYNSGTNQIYVKEGGYNGGYHEGWTPVQPSYNGALVGFIYLGSVNRAPEGSLDLCNGGPGTVRVAGWAKDPDTSAAIQVHVYIGGEAGTSGAEGHVITANTNRSDVGAHAFDTTISTNKTGSQEVHVYAIDSASGTNTQIGSATVNITSANPTGVVDVVSGKCGAVSVRGWAFDPSDTSKQIDIHVYVGADSTAGGGEGHAITANKLREDVHKVYGCGKKHGFDAAIETKKTGKQTVYIYAINIGSGSNQLIGKKTVNITSPNPVGSVDVVDDKVGSILVKGWAFDPNDTSKQISVHVYIGDPKNGGELHTITANKIRTDVDKAYGCGENHGFLETIKTEKTGTQKVYCYGINVGYGANTLLGSKTVTITKATTATTKTTTETITTAAKKTFSKPPATSITKLKKAKKAFKVKWKKKSGIAGYQIMYSTSKSFKKGKETKTVKIKKASTTSKKIKKLKKKKKYYVKIRTYKKVNGKTYYSKWSKVRTVKTK